MKKFLLSSAAIFTLATSPAISADLLVPVDEAPILPVASGPNWTSFYIGGQVGGVLDLGELDDGCGDLEDFDFDPITPLRGLTDATEPNDYTDGEIADIDCESESDGDDATWSAGGHVGADVQYGMFVIGALVDANWVDDDRSTSFSFDPDSGVAGSVPYSTTELPGAISIGPVTDAPGTEASEEGTPLQELSVNEGLQWYGTGRVRAGIAPGGGRFLFYGTGGVSFGEVDSSASRTLTYTPDEADRVFDTPDGVNSNDDEYFPGTEADRLPGNCANGPSFDPDGGGPIGNQTAVICTDTVDESAFRVGFAAGGGVDFLATDAFSIGVEALYVNLGDGGSLFNDIVGNDDDDLDFITVQLRGSLRFSGFGG